MAPLAVLGAGKLGSALAAVLAQRHDVTVYDVDPVPVAAINAGIAPTDEPGLQALIDTATCDDDPALKAALIEHLSTPVGEHASQSMTVPLILHTRGTLRATTDIAEAARAAVAFIVVPTPSDRDGRFSNAHVLDAVGALADEWRGTPAGVHTLVIVSTVMPGSCAGPIKDAANGAPVVYAPQFIALGSVIHDMTHPDVILIGADDSDAADIVEPILVGMTDRGEGICEHDIDADACVLCEGIIRDRTSVHRMSLVEAELAKLALNVSLGVKVALGNEVAYVAEALGADAAKVLAAVGNDSRIGPALLQPGPTAAGPCLGRDVEAFRTLGAGVDVRVSTFVAHGAWQAHRVEPQRVLDRLLWMANGEEPVIGVLGLAYKPGSHVTDAAIGVRVAELALHRSLLVFLHDPKARVDLAGACPLDDAAKVVDAADVILLATPWPEYRTLDYGGKPVLDLWGVVPRATGVHRFGDGAT